MASEEVYNQLAQQVGTDYVNKFAALTGIPTQTTIIILAVVLAFIFIWSLIWKALALWKSAKSDHKYWFVIILIVNTVGILEILYLYVFSKYDWNKSQRKKQPAKNKTAKKKKRR